MREAEIHERGLDDPDAAIDVLSELLAETPDAAAYEAIERLYTVKERWDDLSASYEEQLDRGVGAAVDLRYKLGRLHHQQLGDTLRALDFLRDAVTDDLGHEPSIALLEGILATSGEPRALAGEILEPGYLARMEWPKLVTAVEARIDGEQDVEERKRLLLRLSQIHEDQLENFAAAFDAHTRLFREDPRDRDEWDTLGRLARMGERWRPLAEILSEPLADGASDPDLAALAMLAGGVWDARCEEPSKAAELFAKALAFDPSDERAFNALESTYRRSEAWDELLPLYREQADTADSDERRIDLLKRRAEVLQQHKDDAVAAREAYHEILDVDPDDAGALEMYEQLLADAEEWDVLAEHLRDRVEREMDAQKAVELRVRLAQLHEQKRGDVSAAIDVYEEVTQGDPREKRAIVELERLVQGDAHRLRITLILEPIYRDLDQWKKLIAIDEAQVKLVEDDMERVRLLGEIGKLHEERGGDESLALHAWSRAFVLDPANEDARAHVDRLAVRLNAWDSLVETYEAACERAEDDVVVGTLLGTIAGVHDARRGDPRAAIAAYERLAKHDPQDPVALESLESLHTMVGDWAGLADVLERKVTLSFDVEERGELLRRVGSIHEGFLGDRPSAIEAYQRAVAESDTDGEAYEALDRLYAADRNTEALRDVVARRVELATDAAVRVELGLRLGYICERELRQSDAAVSAYQRVLDDDPTNAAALNALGGLHEQAANWPELLDNLQQRAAIAHDDAERVALRYRSGEVLEREMADVDAAIDAYRDALDIDAHHAKSIDALMRITRNPDHRARAIELVEPLLRTQERWDDVVQIVEQGLDQISDPYERRTELQRVAEVHEQGRQSPRGAFEALRRALHEEPGDEVLLADLERLAGVLDAWGELADAFAQEASSAADPTHASALFRNLARIAEERLGDEARAIDAYVQASEQDDDATETLGDLDRLYLKTERWESLVDVLERRVAATSDPLVRSELLVRLGGVRVEHLEDARGAFVAYREVLEGDPSDARALEGMERLGEHDLLALEVLEILENCYREIGALDKVAGLYDIRVRLAETATERIRLLEEVASIWENDLEDLSRALQARRRAFELDPRATEVLDELERLAESAGTWEGLRGLAEEVASSGAIDERSKRDLYERAAGWYRDRLGDPAAEERCLREVLAITPELPELHERLASLLSTPGRERELVAAWRAWAEVEPDPDNKRERLREAARTSVSALGDAAGAAQCYAALLEVDPNDVDALEQLARLHEEQGRHAEAAELLSRWLSLANDPVQRTELRHRLADMQAAQLGDPAAAIETYQALLDDEPDDVAAADALEGLLAAAERWDELRARLQVRVERAASPAERTRYRVALARLAEQQFGDAAGAIEELMAILDEEPGHPTASAELERLYLESERWAELAALLDRRAQAAADAADVATEADLRRRAAKVAEEHLDDAAAAVASLERAHELAPDDADTLRWLVRLVEASGDWEAVTRHLSALLDFESGDAAIATAHRLAEIADEQLGVLETAESALQRALANGAGADTRERLKALYEKHDAFDRLVAVLVDEEAQASEAADKVALLTRIAELSRDRLGDPGSAASYLERAVALVPDDRDALLGLCDLYIAANRQADAIPVLEKIIGSYGGRRAKEVAVYQHRLGQAHEGMGNLDAAFEHYDAAFKIDLTNAKVLADLGRLSLARDDLARAQKSYRALLLQKLGPDVGIEKADVYFHLGEVSLKQGDKVKAKAMLERAINEAGEHEAARALLDTI
jgi:tetratricopeptide (TPR) repeat protein